MNSALPPSAMTAIHGSCPRLASTSASTPQAAASSIAPAAIASAPTVVPVNPRSKMMRASIGKAVIAIAAPMKGIAWIPVTPATKNPPRSKSSQARPHPSTKGTKIPEAEIASALRSRVRTRSTRNSSPTVNM